MTTYTVVTGDTMWGISRKYGIELNDLLGANPQITNPNLIFPGQIINIPDNNKSTYTVMPGDTMWSIARKYEIDLNNLLAVNSQITNPNLIFPGQTITIPNGTDKTEKDNNIPSDISALENEVIRLVNTEREKAGINALIQNSELMKVARMKSQDFIDKNYFSHTSPTYGTVSNMLETFGITFTAVAENIANGQRNATEVMNSWMNSPGHRDNILSSTYNQIGVGVARDSNGKLFWTQIFIKS